MARHLWLVLAKSVRRTGQGDGSFYAQVNLPRSFIGLSMGSMATRAPTSEGALWKNDDGTWSIQTTGTELRTYQAGELGKLVDEVPDYCLLLLELTAFQGELENTCRFKRVYATFHYHDGELATSGNTLSEAQS